jgi:hypothetical protein
MGETMVRIENKTKTAIEREAKKDGRTIKAEITYIVETYLKSKKN